MIKAVCFDLGDTLVTEETVKHDSSGQSIAAQVIDGAFAVLNRLTEEKYKLVIIANDDGINARNIITSAGLAKYFDVIVISGEMGIQKPDIRIFKAALEALGIEAEEAVMVGNRIDADIIGANKVGMVSLWFKWNDRYPALIDTDEKKPDFTINKIIEILDILDLQQY